MILFKQFYWLSCCHLTFRKIWYCLIKTRIDLVSLSFSFNVIKQLVFSIGQYKFLWTVEINIHLGLKTSVNIVLRSIKTRIDLNKRLKLYIIIWNVQWTLFCLFSRMHINEVIVCSVSNQNYVSEKWHLTWQVSYTLMFPTNVICYHNVIFFYQIVLKVKTALLLVCNMIKDYAYTTADITTTCLDNL